MVEMPKVSVLVKAWDIARGSTGAMTLDAARRAEAVGLDGVVAGEPRDVPRQRQRRAHNAHRDRRP